MNRKEQIHGSENRKRNPGEIFFKYSKHLIASDIEGNLMLILLKKKILSIVLIMFFRLFLLFFCQFTQKPY